MYIKKNTVSAERKDSEPVTKYLFTTQRRKQISFQLDSAIHLSCGYDYTVTLPAVLHDERNFSEWLSKCSTKVYNFLQPNLTEYSKESCFTACLAEKTRQTCGCLFVDYGNNDPFTDAITSDYI